MVEYKILGATFILFGTVLLFQGYNNLIFNVDDCEVQCTDDFCEAHCQISPYGVAWDVVQEKENVRVADSISDKNLLAQSIQYAWREFRMNQSGLIRIEVMNFTHFTQYQNRRGYVCGYYFAGKNSGLIRLNVQPKCYPNTADEKREMLRQLLLHEYTHHRCWLEERYLGHEACFNNKMWAAWT